jgi:hypothetical protein
MVLDFGYDEVRIITHPVATCRRDARAARLAGPHAWMVLDFGYDAVRNGRAVL